MKTISTWLCLVVAAILISGCDSAADDLPKTVDAKGVVTLDGKTIEGALIVCDPIDGQYPASAASDASGSFALKAFAPKDGAVPGQYRVQVSRPVDTEDKTLPAAADLGEDGEHLSEEQKAGITWGNDLPSEYANAQNSGLLIDIPMEGITNIELKLMTTN